MAKQVNREYACLFDMDVVPGYLYDKTLQQYFPRKDGKQIKTVSNPPDFHIDIWNFKTIDNLLNVTQNDRSTWQKDFIQENYDGKSKDIILVRGSKILEEEGIATPLDPCKHTVTSILFKSCLDMLICFSQKPTDGSLKELGAYFNSVLAEEKESFIPEEIRKHFMKAYIYQSYKDPGIKLNYYKHAFEQFCVALKNSKTSVIPLQAVIQSPKPDLLDTVRDVMNVDSESNVTVEPDGDIKTNLDCRSSINSSGKDFEVAKTHMPSKCAKLESNFNSNTQACEAIGELSASKLIEMSSEHGKLQESGSESVSMKRRVTGTAHGSEKSCRDTGDPQNCNAGQTRAESAIGRGLGTRMGRGRPLASDLLSVGRVTQKSCMENSKSNLSPHTFHSNSQTARDFIMKSAHQSSQNIQIYKAQNQANDSKELKNALEESNNNNNNMTEPLQFSNDAEMQIKSQGGFLSSGSSCSSTLLTDVQPAGSLTTVSITLSSQTTNLQEHQTSESQAGSFSCTMGHVANTSHCSETSDNEKLEELDRTKCKTSGENLQDGKCEEMDKLVEKNLREMSYSKECSNTKGATIGKDVNQTKANKSLHMVPTSSHETDRVNFTLLDSHSANGNKTEQGVCQESPMQNNEKPDFALSNCSAKRSCTKSEALLHNGNELKSKIGKNNLKKAKNSGQSDQSYATVVTRKERLETGSGNLKAKQSKSFQGLDNDDEMVDLKSKKNVSHTKQKYKSNKDKNMKTKLLTPVNVAKDACGLERKYFGIVNETVPEKVLILLGASGSGKTTLLNFIANYFHGNKNADDELVHVECTSQTSAITAYTFCSSVEDIPITIIDTPGLNDSSGGEVRDHVQSLKTFLANAASKNVDVHALGFVAQAHLVRLTSSERLVMDYVSTMFGQNISDHLITLVTFADTQDTPPVIEAMKNYKVNFKLFLKFNNSALSNGKTDEVDDLDKVYYRVCWRNWKKCLKTLKDLPPLSVNVMKAVQSEIYNTTVTESAEKDLKAEIAAFFRSYIREKFLSKENLKVCEQIWSLAAVVQRLKGAQMSSRTIEDILLEYAKETCKELRIPPESIVHTLALAPSRALTVVGTEIIQTMSRAYSIMKESEFKCSSKYLIDISHCHNCNTKKEHRMKRTEFSWLKKTAVGSEIICFKCENCKCPGDVHGEQPIQPAHHANKMLQFTVSRLRKALQSYSFSGYAVSEEIFLKHLGENLAFENQDFLDVLLRTMCK